MIRFSPSIMGRIWPGIVGDQEGEITSGWVSPEAGVFDISRSNGLAGKRNAHPGAFSQVPGKPLHAKSYSWLQYSPS
jgi:hypothetical protein